MCRKSVKESYLPVLSKQKTYHISFSLMAIFLVFVMASCSTKKNSFTRRLYHNLTAHYNVYWNGKEALKQAEQDLQLAVKDNFNMILPVFNYGTEAESKTISPLLDRAIEKGSKTILKHSMRFGGKEYVRWIDDAYLLIGKAYFYKRDFFSARRSFSFIMREYESNPIKYEAMLWLARTYIEMEQYEKSGPLLNLIQADIDQGKGNVPMNVFKEQALVTADHFIRQEKYDQAIVYLYDGILDAGNKELKTRARFILAQIYQEEGDLAQASQLYAEVIRRNPPYDMAFQAKINMARAYESDFGDSRVIIKQLTKMLRDDKNKDYLDQIYFALAEVSFKDQQDSLGIEYLKLSVARSVTNNYQKSASALMLADIFFEIPEYESAQAYYDTAVNFLPEDYPNYEEIKNKAGKLSDLVSNLQVVYVEDSLQRLAVMPEQERFKVIDQIIYDLIEEERRQREAEELAQNMATFSQGQSGFNMGQPIGGGKWYFYNPNTMSNGFTEFVRKWGNRKLEDLWRLKDKQIIIYEPDEILDEQLDSLAQAGDTLGIKALDPHNREYYLKNIPFSEQALAKSNKAIAEALYNLGLIYAEGLDNSIKSIESYEELLQRYPDYPQKLKVYYRLYRLYLTLGNSERADYYRDIIVNDHPDSDYAMIILDPDYYKTLQAKETELASLYSQAYQAYERGQYFTVISDADRAVRLYGDSVELIPKFLYLKALSVGRVDVVDSLAVVLRNIVKKYPDSEVKPLAQNLLDYISRDRPDLGTGVQTVKTDSVFKSPYTYTPNDIHLYLLVVKRQAVKLNAIKVRISDHNKNYFGLRQLTVNSLLLDENRYMITVGNFDDAADALSYYRKTSGDPYVFAELGSGNYTEAVISMKNYPVFYKDKNMVLYRKFFEIEYLNK
jgi:tetratricopeptide (TPR) repeat protein